MRNALLLFTFVVVTLSTQAAAQCPTIKVVGPDGMTNPGDDVTFRAEINVVGPKLSYAWSIDKGTIIEGQGTPEIKISTLELSGETVTATVELGGLPNVCERRATESAGVVERLPICDVDGWEELKPNEERGRLDVFFVELLNNPKDVGVFVLRVKPNDKLDSRNNRIKFIMKHAKFREFDKNRIWFALELGDERYTRLYRIPPGGDLNPCEGCLWFKGEHL